jgi:uncharacterized protein (DUF362 family)
MLSITTAVVYHDPQLLSYGARPPFSPSEDYPEYPFQDAGVHGANPAYEAVRQFFVLAGFDAQNFGHAEWNPLGELVHPGDSVAIKPNLVLHHNHNGGPLECVITHGSLIRAVVDYVLIALQGSGTVIIGDAPLQSCDFKQLRATNGLDDVVAFYRQHAPIPVELIDFRCEHARMHDRLGVLGVEAAAGDPSGYAVVGFDKRSMLAPISHRFQRYRVTNYDPACMPLHHNADKHEYLISGSILKADVVISMPKIKTHRKVGITGALKNCVGINGHKDWLPHHTKGPVSQGGDEYAHASMLKVAHCALVEADDRTRSRAVKELLRIGSGVLHRASKAFDKDPFFEGSWWGNDTIWRMVLDLNRALIYSDHAGVLRNLPQRRVFFLADGIIAGEGEGPVNPDPKPIGVLLGGYSGAVVDAVMARLMGFDFCKIPLVREAFCIPDLPLTKTSPDEIEIISNCSAIAGLYLQPTGKHFGFTPSSGWRDHIELRAPDEVQHASNDDYVSR